MIQLNQPEANWRHIPLCTKYLLVLLETRLWRAPRDGAVSNQAVRWALGTLADGQCEVLGVWPGEAVGTDQWEEVFGELKLRGVEAVRFVAGDESIDVSAVFPGAMVLPLLGQASRRGMAILGPEDRMLATEEFDGLLAIGSLGAAHAQLTNQSTVPMSAKRAAVLESWRGQLDGLAPFFALSPKCQHAIRFADAEVRRLDEVLCRVAVREAGLFGEGALAEVVVGTLVRAGRKRDGNGSDASRRFAKSVRTDDCQP